MSKTPRTAAWRAASLAVLAATWLALCDSRPARAGTLFPKPLHLTRVNEDPITGASECVEEYCFGNRAGAVRGQLRAILDYENELTTIDRDAGTFSVSASVEPARPQAKVCSTGRAPEPGDLELRSGEPALALHLTRLALRSVFAEPRDPRIEPTTLVIQAI